MVLRRSVTSPWLTLTKGWTFRRSTRCHASSPLIWRLSEAGDATGEKVWRMPLSAAYDKLIDSDIADMKNIGGRFGGSITAAQFIQRFVNKVPWAHLDIAGTAFPAKDDRYLAKGATGFGVRVVTEYLRRLVPE